MQQRVINLAALRAVALALAATFFFSMTFVLNRRLVVTGGYWAWAVILRYVITATILGPLVVFREGMGKLPEELRSHWKPWLFWSAIGFGLFGTCLTWAASSGPAWLVVGGFQFTVVAGPLMAPFIYPDSRSWITLIPMAVGALILGGVVAMQWGRALSEPYKGALPAAIAVFVSACAYPLGNRMIMLHLERCGSALSSMQRVFGMTLASLIVWVPLAVIAILRVGFPTWTELTLAGGVAVSSGVIATLMFFGATDAVKHNRVALAAVESMQAGELLFSALMGALLLGENWPHGISAAGATTVIAGIVAFASLSARA